MLGCELTCMSPPFLRETSTLRPFLASPAKPRQQQVPEAFKAPLSSLYSNSALSGASDLWGYIDGEGEAEARTDRALGAWEAVPLGKEPL